MNIRSQIDRFKWANVGKYVGKAEGRELIRDEGKYFGLMVWLKADFMPVANPLISVRDALRQHSIQHCAGKYFSSSICA